MRDEEEGVTMTMILTIRNILFDLSCNNHNIYSSFRKYNYKLVWRLLLRTNKFVASIVATTDSDSEILLFNPYNT